MSQYTVSEASARTGFSPSALRYYDDVGLVRPAARSDAGYRLYDDRSLQRLGFIARGKRLGLSLHEITELVSLWDEDQCAPVQERLAELVAAKLVETQHAIAELAGFESQLSEIGTRLEVRGDGGACDDDCACATVAATSPPTPRFGRSAAPVKTPIPIVCDVSTAPDTVHERIDSYRRLFADALVGREWTVAGTRFRFRADEGVEARVRELAALEQRCCAFFTFTITLTGGEVLWDSSVVDDGTARAVLDEWFELPETVGKGVVATHDRMVSAGLRFSGDPLAPGH